MLCNKVESLTDAITLYGRADVHRHVRGHVKVMAQTWHDGIDSLLCVQHGNVHVITGAELDESALCVPRRYANVHVVPDHDNMLQLTVLSQARDAHDPCIFVSAKDRRVRDEWLAWLRALLGTESHRDKMPDVAERGYVLNGSLPLVKWIY